ncbi:MAG: hypothetical protein ACLVCA_02780 [Peptoniphilus sp.]|uniref:hypothetical protein n=1 Tax=Peptoniphilus sp. TaxID=1971214 RepID=UPI00399A1074
MNYTEKLVEIEKVINYLNENNYNNSLANRIYYFCFQSMILSLNDIYDEKERYLKDGESTHKYTLEMYLKTRFVKPHEIKDKQNFYRRINQVKKLRIKADYYKDSLSKDEAKDLMEIFLILKKLM